MTWCCKLTTIYCLVMILVLGQLPVSVSHAVADNYYSYVLNNGKLQRFNDQTRMVYYSVDNLDNLPDWDYTKWHFLKDQIVRDAFAEWERALNGQIIFRDTTDSKLTDIAVHWRTGFGSNQSLLGLERPRYTGGKYLTNADIQITLTRSGKTLSNEEIKAIALHEIGHALGINGHSPYQGDIMYPAIQPGVSRLSPRDIKTIQLIYSNTPDVTNPPGVHLVLYRRSQELFQQGLKAFKSEQYAQAYQQFSQACRDYPLEQDYQFMAGMAAYHKHDFPQATVHFGQAMRLPGRYQLEAQFQLAESLAQQGVSTLKQGNKVQAVQYFQQSQNHFATLSKNPRTPQNLKSQVQARHNWLQQTLNGLTGKNMGDPI